MKQAENMDLVTEGYGYKTPASMCSIDCREADWLALPEKTPDCRDFRLEWAGQGQLEQFIGRYAPRVRRLVLFSPKIADLTPLEALRQATHIMVKWNTRAERLWDLSRSPALLELSLDECWRLHALDDLAAGTGLRGLQISGGVDKKWRLQSLEPLRALQNLRVLRLFEVDVGPGGFAPLYGLTGLRRLDLAHNLCATEEYARLAARLPNTECDCFRGVVELASINEILVVGKGKRALNLTTQADRAKECEAAFGALVARYRGTQG